MPVALSVDTSDLVKWEQVLSKLPVEIRTKVMVRTLNRVGDMARTKCLRALAEQTGLKYGDVNELVRRRPAGPSGLAYELHGKGPTLTLRRFGPVQTREGVRARPWGRERVFRGAFIVRSLAPLAFKRKGPSRLPIEPLYGPSIPKELVKDKSAAAFAETAKKEMGPRLEHELKFALTQLSQGKFTVR